MRYLALCCDYDGTLATEGAVLPSTAAALERLTASGRRLVLVTGRELDELQSVCRCLELFEYVVAENGGLLYEPATDTTTALAEPPPDSFIAALRARGVGPLSVGQAIVATWEPHETAVLETIKAQGLELQVIFNKGAVMILPAGVNKATGLTAALERMALSPHNAVGIGDAENDHALLSLCECGVAVANALPTLKAKADLVMSGARGAGVEELIEALLRDDLASCESRLLRHHIPLGFDDTGREVRIRPYGENVLLVGTAAAHSAWVRTLLCGLAAAKYSYCLLDSQGAYESAPGAVSLGSAERAPSVEEILKLFRTPDESGIINLTALSAGARQEFLGALATGLARLRGQLGRPHWLAGSPLLPSQPEHPDRPGNGASLLQITASPRHLPVSAAAGVSLLLASGDSPARSIQEFCQIAALSPPPLQPVSLQPGETLAWRPRAPQAAPFRLRIKQ